MKPRIYKLHCVFAFEERFWEWLRYKHYQDNKIKARNIPSKSDFQKSLVDFNEIFVSPCVLNPINCGAPFLGSWLPKIKFLCMEMPEENN